MPKFAFKARDAQKKLIEGFRFGVTSKDVVSDLQNEGLTPISVDEVIEKSAAKKKKTELFGSRRISNQDVAVFCRQLATLINAGVTILDSIEDISEMSSNAKFRGLLKTVANDIRQGGTFSEALKKHPSVFSKIFVSMVTAGERSGKLGNVLKELAIYLENAVKLKRKIRAASAYPAMVGIFFLVVMLALVFFIIPKFKALFASFGSQLPAPTLAVMYVSDAIVHNFLWITIAVILIIFLIKMLYRTTPGKLVLDNLKLKTPVFGAILKKIIFARFFQTLSTLLKSGVDIIASIEIASKISNNLPVENIMDAMRAKILEGSSLSNEMGSYKLFPRMIVRMVAVGEKSGQMDEMLSKISDYYTDEVDGTVAVLSSIIEPVLIIMLGFIVGLVVVCMYLPIFNLARAMMGGM